MQSLVGSRPQRRVDRRQQVDPLEQQRHRTLCGLRPVTFGHAARHLKQRQRLRILAHQQVAEMAVQPRHESLSGKTLAQHLVEKQQSVRIVSGQDLFGDRKIGIVIEHVERRGHLGDRQILPAERNHLVEHRQRVAHSAVGLAGDQVQRLVVVGHSFLRSDVFEVLHAVLDANPVEIVNLTARQDRRNDLVLFGRSQDKHGMCGRLFERFQKRVERLHRQHVHLVDDIDAVTTDLRRNTHLVGQVADIVHRVVRRGVQFVDIERPALVERTARFALVAGFGVGPRIQAVDRFGEDPRASRLADAARPAEQVRMRQLATADRILQRRGNMRLSDDRCEGRRTVFPGRYDEIIHNFPFRKQRYEIRPESTRRVAFSISDGRI